MVRNPWAVAILLIVFLIVLQQGLKFWRNPEVPEPVKKTVEEAFTNPTSVLECRCLPGYQPSNSTSNSKSGQVVALEIALDGGRKLYIPGFVFTGGKELYILQPDSRECLPSALEFSFDVHIPIFPLIKISDIKIPGRQEGGTYTYVGDFDCSLLKQTETRKLPYYQCQNINDPTKTRPCY